MNFSALRHLMMPRATLLPLLVLAAASHASAQAPTVIDAVPYTITVSGRYVLNSNFNSTQTSGNIITVNASNVVIDMQDHYIAGPVGLTGQTTNGIFAAGRNNITILNGTVSYCYTGIKFGSTSTPQSNVNQRVMNMRLTHCYYQGVEFDDAHSSNMVNSQISAIGGTSTSGSYTSGVRIFGSGVTVQGNTISDITGTVAAPDNSVGIYADTGSFSRGNTVSTAHFGVAYGKYQDNLTNGCTQPFSGGTDAGGNN